MPKSNSLVFQIVDIQADDISILKKSKNIYYEESHFPFMEISEKNLKT